MFKKYDKRAVRSPVSVFSDSFLTSVFFMIALLQRVSQARVEIEGQSITEIGRGLLVLVCAERGDTESQADRLLDRMLAYRVFSDAAGKMNLSLKDVEGGLLLVPQFTLAADTRKGTRPSFTPAATPDVGKRLFEHMVSRARELHSLVSAGQFGADMQVSLTNNGPVTIWLQVES